ncbi:MAG TPA: hypothetical protein VEM76_08435 [Anaeromyxobacteraceae bacterium]|nr:hypothetical protein [Anaeromyxobacteraceae bacterium]
MTTARPSLVASLALALAGCSGPLVGADIDEPRICLVMHSQTVPGAPIPTGMLLPEQAVTWEGDLDLGSKLPGLDKDGAVTGSLRMLSLTTTGSTDLSSISSADVALVDAADQPTTFMSYTRPTPVTTPEVLDMKLDQDLNLLDALQSGLLRYRITFKGQPPPTSWTADIETCLSAHLTVDALKAMK